VLANAELYWSARDVADQLQQALTTRPVIDQAKGIIMGERGGDADAAFAALRSLSQHRHVKLRDLAQEIADAAGEPPSAMRSPPAACGSPRAGKECSPAEQPARGGHPADNDSPTGRILLASAGPSGGRRVGWQKSRTRVPPRSVR
jgi:ANTAR domain